MFLTLLKMREFRSASSCLRAAKQDCENRPVSFAFESVGIGRLAKPTRFVRREPVSEPHADFPDTLHATDAGRELRTKYTGIRRLVRKPAHRGQPPVDRSGREATVLERNPETGHDDLVERQSGLRTVPLNELVDGTPVPSLGFRRAKALEYRRLALGQVRKTEL